MENCIHFWITEKRPGGLTSCSKCGLVNNFGEKKRPKTTQTVIDEFTKVLDAQDDKGMVKYGVSIDDAEDNNYDWPLMAMEELADFSKYQVKEIKRLQRLIKAWKETSKDWERQRKQLHKERDEAKQWAKDAEITANEMAEESAVMIEQLQREIAILKSDALLETAKLTKHHCGKHVTIVWDPMEVNEMKGVKCKECGKVTYFEK